MQNQKHSEPEHEVLKEVKKKPGDQVLISPGAEALVHGGISGSDYLHPGALVAPLQNGSVAGGGWST